MKYALNFLGAIASGSDAYYSSKGAAWLSQLREDYWIFFQDRTLYKIERVDDTTLRVIWADANCNPTFAITYKYTQNGPYNESKQITVEKLFEGPASAYKTIDGSYYPIPCADR